MRADYLMPALPVIPLLGGLLAAILPASALWAIFLLVAAGVIGTLAPMPGALISAGPMRYSLGGWGVPLGIDLYMDGTGLVLLVMTAGLMIAIAFYSRAYFGSGPRARRFWPLFLLVWASLNNLFVTGDIFNMYVTLELLGLLSVGLIALAGTPEAYAAALRYLLAALCGSLFYLLGVAMVYSNSGNLDWMVLRFHLVNGPSAYIALGLMTAGLMLKSAVFPLHFWLPRAHASAPAPVSALLSALMIKASFYIALRMWLWVFPGAIPTDTAGPLFGILGAAAIIYGSLQAFRQRRLKLLIAYSTVAQLGYLFVFFALSMRPEGVEQALQAVVFFAVSHAFAKAALFMASGALIRSYGHDWIEGLQGCAERLPALMFAFGLAGVSIIGLPPSGGFIGKYLLMSAALEQGQWFWAVVLALGGLLAAAYIFKVINVAMHAGHHVRLGRPVSGGLVWPVWALAIVALLLGLLAFRPLEIIAIGSPVVGSDQSNRIERPASLDPKCRQAVLFIPHPNPLPEGEGVWAKPKNCSCSCSCSLSRWERGGVREKTGCALNKTGSTGQVFSRPDAPCFAEFTPPTLLFPTSRVLPGFIVRLPRDSNSLTQGTAL